MSNDFDKYLAIANHDIQMANDDGQLKSYVASILYDYDKKVELLQQKENIIKEVRKYIEENTNSDSFTVLTSGKITDIAYCIVAFEDILEILDKDK